MPVNIQQLVTDIVNQNEQLKLDVSEVEVFEPNAAIILQNQAIYERLGDLIALISKGVGR